MRVGREKLREIQGIVADEKGHKIKFSKARL